MVDELTRKPLKVSTDGTAGPYIEVAESQLQDVCEILERNGIRHWVEENLISIDDSPFVGVINLGRGGDAEAVQAILDSVQPLQGHPMGLADEIQSLRDGAIADLNAAYDHDSHRYLGRGDCEGVVSAVDADRLK